MGIFSTIVLAAATALAAPPGAEPGLLSDKTLRLPLYPVALDLEQDGRVKWVRLAFLPFAFRSSCHGRFLKECRDLAIEKGLAAYARHEKEPGQILELKIGGGKASLLGRLSATPAVRSLRERVDVTWVPAGEGKEYPLDKRRLVTARVRWRSFANGERLELVDILK